MTEVLSESVPTVTLENLPPAVLRSMFDQLTYNRSLEGAYDPNSFEDALTVYETLTTPDSSGVNGNTEFLGELLGVVLTAHEFYKGENADRQADLLKDIRRVAARQLREIDATCRPDDASVDQDRQRLTLIIGVAANQSREDTARELGLDADLIPLPPIAHYEWPSRAA